MNVIKIISKVILLKQYIKWCVQSVQVEETRMPLSLFFQVKSSDSWFTKESQGHFGFPEDPLVVKSNTIL